MRRQVFRQGPNVQGPETKSIQSFRHLGSRKELNSERKIGPHSAVLCNWCQAEAFSPEINRKALNVSTSHCQGQICLSKTCLTASWKAG